MSSSSSSWLVVIAAPELLPKIFCWSKHFQDAFNYLNHEKFDISSFFIRFPDFVHRSKHLLKWNSFKSHVFDLHYKLLRVNTLMKLFTQNFVPPSAHEFLLQKWHQWACTHHVCSTLNPLEVSLLLDSQAPDDADNPATQWQHFLNFYMKIKAR